MQEGPLTYLLVGGLSSHHMSNNAVQVSSRHGAWLSLVRLTQESKKKAPCVFMSYPQKPCSLISTIPYSPPRSALLSAEGH